MNQYGCAHLIFLLLQTRRIGNAGRREIEEEALELEDSTPAYLQTSSMPAVPGKAVGEGEEKEATKTDEFGLPAVPN